MDRITSITPATVWRYWAEEPNGTIHPLCEWSTDQERVVEQLKGALSATPGAKGYTEWKVVYLLPRK